MTRPIYFSFLIFTFLITDVSFSSLYARYREEGWGRSRHVDEYDRDEEEYDRRREKRIRADSSQYDREERRSEARERIRQERIKKEIEARRKKYHGIREVTSIFDSVSKKISDDALSNIFRTLQSTFGDDVTYQIIDSLSQGEVRKQQLEDFFDGDEFSEHLKITLDDNFYARLLASLALSKSTSQSTVKDFSTIMEQKLSSRWDNIRLLKVQIVEKKMGYIPEKQLAPLVKIMNQAVKSRDISENFMSAAFESIKEKFDPAFAYQLVNTLTDKGVRSQLVSEQFDDGKPEGKTEVVISAQFYATLVDALYQDENIEPADVDIFVQLAENVLKRQWREIDLLRTQTASQSEDAWGAADNAAQIQTRELDNILRQRNVNTDKIKAQFIIDFLTTYMTTQETATVSAFGSFETAQDTRLDRFKSALKSVKSTYITKISDKRYARNISDANFSKDFSALIDKVEKMTMQIDGPRYTPWLFQTYLSKLTNQNFKMQIQNGLRIDVTKAFADFAESKTSGKPVPMNSDMLYLLCIQLIGTLEKEILSGDSVTKVQDFIKNAQELIQVILPPKFNNTPAVTAILQTILQTIPAQVQKPDANTLFGVGIFNMIKSFGLNDSIQKVLVQRIQPTLAQMNISNQTVAQ